MTDEPSTELCGETNQSIGWITLPCGLVKDHEGDRHIPDPSKPNAGWWRTAPEPVFPPDRCKSLYSVDGEQMQCERPKDHPAWHSAIGVVWEGSAPTCSAVLHLSPRANATYECTLPQGHTEFHRDADGDAWDITWTRPQSARMEVPAPPLTFSRDKRLRALEEFQDHVTATLKSVGDRLRGLEERSAPGVPFATERPSTVVYGVSQLEWQRTMGRVTATLDAIGPRLVGRGPDRTSEVVAKLGEILERLGPPDVERCARFRPGGKLGNPDDLCVRPEGHTDRHVNGITTWPNTVMHVSDRCEVKHPETGHPCWKVVGPNMQPHTTHCTAYWSVWESERTHDADCERGPDHTDECCSHPNGVGPNGCAGCGDYRQD